MTHTMIFQVDTDATVDAAHAALTTADRVTAWWTDTATVPETVGGHLEVTFPGVPLPFDLILDENGPGRVTWRAGGFPPPWEGTTCTWDLADNPDADGTRVRFEHSGWQESNPASAWSRSVGARSSAGSSTTWTPAPRTPSSPTTQHAEARCAALLRPAARGACPQARGPRRSARLAAPSRAASSPCSRRPRTNVQATSMNCACSGVSTIW